MCNVVQADRILAALEPRLDEFGDKYPGGAVIAYLADNANVIAQLYPLLAGAERAMKTHKMKDEAILIPFTMADVALVL